MLTFQFVLVSLAALISIFFGIRYFLAKQFMPYHAVVAGKSWSELAPGVQTIILAMLRIIGGGFVTYGLALLWLLLPLSARQPWAGWAVLTISAPTLLTTLYVTIALRRFAPSAPTPVVPASVVLALALVGGGISFFN
jgi:uncharacterized protein YjeT (DUF2065 family)